MKLNRLSIAITGGIGSGKSEVCRWFRDQDIPVVSADSLGHELLKSKSVQDVLRTIFGDEIWVNNQIDRNILGNIVFENEEKTAKLNEIMHPRIINKLKKTLKNQSAEIAIYEIPLLFEAGLENLFDIIMTVWASEDVRIDRLKKRPGMTEAKMDKIMAQQCSKLAAIARSDYVIENNGSIAELETAITELYKKLKERL
ncbi:MAG: dephospho-CoA kinase [Candidatus Cloacimonetes bacterium]|nr:dephospho-CoA kinase [Candidatus Cloacimonadota bacterium]